MSTRVSAFARLMRVDRGVAAALYVPVGISLSTGRAAVSLRDAVVAMLVVALLTWFGNAINDVTDRHVDALSRPERPIPSGVVSAQVAARFAWTLAAAGMALSITLGTRAAVVAAVALVLAAAYSLRLKGTLLAGNAAVGLCVGAVMVFGGVVAGHVTPPILWGAAMTAIYCTTQEVLFNIEDEDGDRRAGQATTAARLGRGRAIRVHRLLAIAFVCVALAPVGASPGAVAYLWAVTLCAVAPTIIVLALLARATESRIATAARWSRVTWVAGVIPLLLLPP